MSPLFFVIALLIVSSGIGVVAFRNPVHNALCLFVNLLGVAAIYATLAAHFLAIVQIIVYAGAVVVLVLFVIMLLNLRAESKRHFGVVISVLAILSGAAFLGVSLPLFRDASVVFQNPETLISGSANDLGELLFNRYVFDFEMAGMLLLAATVGAVMVAKRRDVQKTSGGKTQ